MAVELESGRVVWETPNTNAWKMTHSSVMPLDLAGSRQYVYCANGGVVGVSAADGKVLWQTPEWKIIIANIPSPVMLGDGRIFLSGGYDAGCMMIQVREQAGQWTVKTLLKLEPRVFGAAQQTPIYHQGYVYGVRPDERFVCLDPAGKVVWTSSPSQKFGLGPFILVNGLIYALNDRGKLSLVEATPARFNLLAEAQVLEGRDCWGPMALVGNRLLARDLTRLVCLDVAAR
jgi:outer membrane protein assembly factor BamB